MLWACPLFRAHHSGTHPAHWFGVCFYAGCLPRSTTKPPGRFDKVKTECLWIYWTEKIHHKINHSNNFILSLGVNSEVQEQQIANVFYYSYPLLRCFYTKRRCEPELQRDNHHSSTDPGVLARLKTEYLQMWTKLLTFDKERKTQMVTEITGNWLKYY